MNRMSDPAYTNLVHADGIRLYQICMNLLRLNAYTDKSYFHVAS